MRISVVCQECGKKFKTAKVCPECPKCHGVDIEPNWAAVNKVTPVRCADCGEKGETTGHMTCAYPGRYAP
jgi:hypothetical protein